MEPTIKAEEDDLLETSAYLALFLLNSYDFEIVNWRVELKEVESRLMPLLENGVLGYGTALRPSHCGAVHSRLTAS